MNLPTRYGAAHIICHAPASVDFPRLVMRGFSSVVALLRLNLSGFVLNLPIASTPVVAVSSPVGAVERAIADGFRDMSGAYLCGSVQICDSPADFEYPIISTR